MSFTSGIIDAGMSKSFSSSSSHCSVWMLNSIVREALLTSVTWTSPRVSRQISHVSTVPNISLPCSARSAGARHVVQNPFDLRGAEIGVDDESRPFRG